MSIEHTNATNTLVTLVNDYVYQKEYTLTDDTRLDFTQKVMTLIAEGASSTVRATIGSKGTLLHYFVLENEDNHNNKAIAELLELNPTLAKTLDAHGYTPLQALINQSDLSDPASKKTAMLLKEDSDFNSQAALLHHYVANNETGVHDQEISIILKQHPTLVDAHDHKRCTPLQNLMNQWLNDDCCLTDFKHTAMILVNAGCSLSVLDNTHRRATLLHHLQRTNHRGVNDKDIHCLLTNHKSLVNVVDHQGNTVLHQLLYGTDVTLDMVRQFMPFSTHRNHTNERGFTVLHVACFAGHLHIAQYLVEQHLNIHALTDANQTMLHLTAFNCNAHLYSWLISKQIDIHAEDVFGQTAVQQTLTTEHTMTKHLSSNNAYSYKTNQTTLFFQKPNTEKQQNDSLHSLPLLTR